MELPLFDSSFLYEDAAPDQVLDSGAIPALLPLRTKDNGQQNATKRKKKPPKKRARSESVIGLEEERTAERPTKRSALRYTLVVELPTAQLPQKLSKHHHKKIEMEVGAKLPEIYEQFLNEQCAAMLV